MIIRKGTTVYPSERGHYNFHYPKKSDPYQLNIDIEVKSLPWIHEDGVTPVEVVSPQDYLPYVVLWIKEPV